MPNDITINIGARNKASAVMSKVGNDVKSFGSRVKSATTSLQGMFGVIAGAAAVVGVLRSITGEMERIDTIAKTSRKLGLFTEDLIGLRLAAAEFSGMAEGQLDVALQRMTRRLSEAADKTQTAALTMDGSVVQLSGVRKAIADIGLSVEHLNNIGPARAFREIADAVKKVQNPADQLRIAFTLFDSEGASLVNTLTQGSDAIDKMNIKAKELGLTFTDLEANQVEAANDAIHEMTEAWGGLKRELAIGLSPTLRSAAEEMESLISKGGPIRSLLGKIQTAYIGFQIAQMDFLGRVTGGTGIVPVIGKKGFEPAFNNVMEEASGVRETQRAQAQKRELLRIQEERKQRSKEWNAIIDNAKVDYIPQQPTAPNSDMLGTQQPTERGYVSDQSDIYKSTKDWLNGILRAEKPEREYNVRVSTEMDGTLFARQSRLMSGQSEQRRNPVVQQIEKLERTFTDAMSALADAQIDAANRIIAAQPEFEVASVEVITT